MNFVKKLLVSMLQRSRRKKLSKCGDHVYIGKGSLSGHIEIGSHVTIGRGAWCVSSRAKIVIHDHVVIAPNVTIYTGDHMTDQIGKHINEITDADKDASDKVWDKDVVIESGCWIGTRAIILKGVTIGRGSVVGAGAVVTKDIPPYSIYVGVPSARTLPRFSEEQIALHEQMLTERGKQPDAMSC